MVNYRWREISMELIIVKDYEEASDLAFKHMVEVVKNNPCANLGLATGPSLEASTIFFRTTFKSFLSICRFYRLFLYFLFLYIIFYVIIYIVIVVIYFWRCFYGFFP